VAVAVAEAGYERGFVHGSESRRCSRCAASFKKQSVCQQDALGCAFECVCMYMVCVLVWYVRVCALCLG